MREERRNDLSDCLLGVALSSRTTHILFPYYWPGLFGELSFLSLQSPPCRTLTQSYYIYFALSPTFIWRMGQVATSIFEIEVSGVFSNFWSGLG